MSSGWPLKTLFLFTLAASSTALQAAPLRVNPSNRRYFIDGNGQPVYLVGSHTHTSIPDAGSSDPPLPFDFSGFLNFLSANNHNYTRFWMIETPKVQLAGGGIFRGPLPWARTGPGTAQDGKPKYDLYRFDDVYFSRLRNRAIEAGSRGIYVSIMLFQSWDAQNWSYNELWRYHPYHALNNVNGIEADLNGNGEGIELYSAGGTVLDAQKAYARKVVDTLNDLDNVMYEIANESTNASAAWQHALINYIHAYEAGKPKQHPVGITCLADEGPGMAPIQGPYSDLINSPAEWISPCHPAGGDWMNNPPDVGGAKVVLLDTDHIWGTGGNVSWVWKTFTRGHHPIFMDFPPLQGTSTCCPLPGDAADIRRTMGLTLTYAKQMNLNAALPVSNTAICSSGYCLIHPGQTYLAFLPNGGSVILDLTGAAGSFNVEWRNARSGAILAGAAVSGGAKCTLSAPFGGEAVVFLKSTGSPVPPLPPPPPPPPPPTVASPGTVTNLSLSQIGSSSMTLSFTQVDDGMGAPAKYDIRLSSSGALWGGGTSVIQGTCSTPLQGTATSGTLTCTVLGLAPSTRYDFQLIAFRGTMNQGATYGGLSNTATATTGARTTPSSDGNGDGVTNVADVQLSVNQALGTAACTTADVNGDGACTVVDVQKIVNAALGS